MAKKRDTARTGPAGPAAAHAKGMKSADKACCGCGVAPNEPAGVEPFGPGSRAAGVDPALKKANLSHLRRIEGQVRGIAAMIAEDRYCADIIQQCAAVQESLRAVAKNLLRNHLRHCADRGLRGGKQERAAMVTELVGLIAKVAR